MSKPKKKGFSLLREDTQKSFFLVVEPIRGGGVKTPELIIKNNFSSKKCIEKYEGLGFSDSTTTKIWVTFLRKK